MADDSGRDSGPKLHIDSDWKAEAQAEKERLAQEAEQRQASSAGGRAGARAGRGDQGGQAGAAGLPPASFETLISTLATQALFALGAFPDPRTGQASANLDMARHHIDMLGVIEEKTKGNLSQEEAGMLASTAYELRSRYIQAAQAALAKQ